ncbi:diacylglycerol/polyprenol kinase family protein [Phormidium sp. CCY1219]|uniref:diacylglycerol/polyprenol kinase family protein n=1 Tax=Phormidium sp. CCY1219 TaxID=2886104 RepID=UPI002D1F714B|nr:hypothetical protein [Phormidium sp. CCY1219]MEB3829756.1 hypothetical protein [Phormidium sp. CCY1219]
MMTNPWIGISVVLAILGTAIAALTVFKRKANPHPELLRKLLHVQMGLVTIAFPWMFRESWPVFLLAAIAIGLMLALKTIKSLQQVGEVVHRVGRRSLGEIYFPLSVAVVFWLAQGHWILYCIPILVLTLADAVAAAIGLRYGTVRYTTTDGQKSAEGSIAFFTLAFLTTHVPLLLLTDTPRAQTLLVSAILGLLVMLMEAIAWQGLDNLFIPLGSFVVLKMYLPLTVPELTARAIGVAILVAFVLIWRDRTTLNDSALLGVALAGYASCFLVSFQWILPPLILFLSYSLLCPWTKVYNQRRHDIYAVMSISFTGALWLLLARIFHQPQLFYPYTIAFAAHLAIIDLVIPKEHPRMPKRKFLTFALTAILKSGLLLFVPYAILEGAILPHLPLAFAAIALAAFSHCCAEFLLRQCPHHLPLWVIRAAIVTLCSAIGLIPLYPIPG